jgi:hypothetical protein
LSDVALATIGAFVARITFITVRTRRHSAAHNPFQIGGLQFSNSLFLQAELFDDALAAPGRGVISIPCRFLDDMHTLVSFRVVYGFAPDLLRPARRRPERPVLTLRKGKTNARAAEFFYGLFL